MQMQMHNESANGTSLDRVCKRSLKALVGFTTMMFVTIILNTVFVIIIQKTRSETRPCSRKQGYILVNIAVINIVQAVIVPALLVIDYFLVRKQNCKQIMTVMTKIILATHNCSFMNYILLNINRYISCLFPLRYQLLIPDQRTFISIVATWFLTGIGLGFGFLGNPLFVQSNNAKLSQFDFYVFIAIFLLCLTMVLIMNIHMWVMGYVLYQKDLRVALAVIADNKRHPAIVRRNNLKAAFVSFVLTLKNMIAFFPVVLLVLMRLTGNDTPRKMELQSSLGQFAAMSLLLDPCIFIVLNKEAREYVSSKAQTYALAICNFVQTLCRCGNNRVASTVQVTAGTSRGKMRTDAITTSISLVHHER
eukprot:Seg2809.5 transcript_id=Seg2809.5/GoldUCD/mRNA.D3Y31 product="hypothetical protein" protein_id=Seg2809.5/GoldUCD/D3Y31